MPQRRTYRRLNNPSTNSRPHGMKETSEAMCYLEDLRSEFPRMEFTNIVKLARERHGVTIPFTTLYRWWQRFLDTGLFPYEHYEMENKKKQLMKLKHCRVITEEILRILDDITDNHPEYYIDEIQRILCRRCRKFVSESTIRRALKDHLNKSLQVLYESAKLFIAIDFCTLA